MRYKSASLFLVGLLLVGCSNNSHNDPNPMGPSPVATSTPTVLTNFKVSSTIPAVYGLQVWIDGVRQTPDVGTGGGCGGSAASHLYPVVSGSHTVRLFFAGAGDDGAGHFYDFSPCISDETWTVTASGIATSGINVVCSGIMETCQTNVQRVNTTVY